VRQGPFCVFNKIRVDLHVISGLGTVDKFRPKSISADNFRCKLSVLGFIDIRSRNPRLTAVGISCADHASPSYPQRLALTSPTSGGLSVGIVRLRKTGTELSFFSFF
jgi:hypothetical protein